MAKKRRAGEGSIFKRLDGRWCASIHLSWEGVRRKRKYLYGATRQKVAEELTKVLRDKAQGLPVALERQTVAQFLESWLENDVKPATRPATFESYKDTVRLHITPTLGSLSLAKLAPQHVQTLLKKKLDEGLSATVRRLHSRSTSHRSEPGKEMESCCPQHSRTRGAATR